MNEYQPAKPIDPCENCPARGNVVASLFLIGVGVGIGMLLLGAVRACDKQPVPTAVGQKPAACPTCHSPEQPVIKSLKEYKKFHAKHPTFKPSDQPRDMQLLADLIAADVKP